MARPGEDDRDAVNRAFAELVAGYHLTSDRPDPLVDQRGAPGGATGATKGAEDTESDWTTILPLFRLLDPGTEESEPDGKLGERPFWPAEAARPAPAPKPASSGPAFSGPFPSGPSSSGPAPSGPVSIGSGELDDDRVDAYVPDPLPPLTRPGIPALVGWIGIGYAALLMVAGVFGLPVPTWAGWLAVGAFLIGFGILLTQLPRHRPPEAGDGAVL